MSTPAKKLEESIEKYLKVIKSVKEESEKLKKGK
jgi:hypothetical protein